MRRPLLLLSVAGALALASAVDAPAQERPVDLRSTEMRANEDEVPVTPRGAFLRSLLIPGWGHAAVGARGRGGAYFLIQSASIWMMFQSRSLRGTARELQEMERVTVEARLRAEGVTDPVELRRAVEEDPRVAERAELVETRSQQVEDWTALAVFLVLLIGADAFVSAHLADFPEPLNVQVSPAGRSGRFELGLSLSDRLFLFR